MFLKPRGSSFKKAGVPAGTQTMLRLNTSHKIYQIGGFQCRRMNLPTLKMEGTEKKDQYRIRSFVLNFSFETYILYRIFHNTGVFLCVCFLCKIYIIKLFRFFRNVGTYLPNYTASHSRRS
jgi:hypothetical protein